MRQGGRIHIWHDSRTGSPCRGHSARRSGQPGRGDPPVLKSKFARAVAATALVAGVAGFTAAASAQDKPPIKVGVLHSLSGTMAISETTLKDTVLMMVDDINKKGGLLGRKVEAVVVDPASDWPLFAEKARELLTKDKV